MAPGKPGMAGRAMPVWERVCTRTQLAARRRDVGARRAVGVRSRGRMTQGRRPAPTGHDSPAPDDSEDSMTPRVALTQCL